MKTLDFRGFVGQKVDAKPELSHTEYIAVSGVLGLPDPEGQAEQLQTPGPGSAFSP